MRLGVDAHPLRGVRTGIGNYTWNLLRELPSLISDLKVFLYHPGGFACKVPPELKNVVMRHSNSLPFMSGHFWVKMHARELIIQDELDVFWAPRTLYPLRIGHKVPVVTSVHDFNAMLFPETMKLTNLIAHKIWFRSDLLKAKKAVTVSQGTAQCMKDLIGRDTDAIVPPGVENRFCLQANEKVNAVKSQYGLNRKYLIFVGTFEPRKNLEQLLLAHKEVNVHLQEPIELLLIGQRGWRNQDLIKRLNNGVVNVRELGFVPDEDLPGLYAGSEAMVMPSLYEGYGMPAAEARACGTRVVVSDIPELHEAAGTDAIYVHPSAASIADGIRLALNSPRPAWKPAHSWRESAQVFADILRDAARECSKEQ